MLERPTKLVSYRFDQLADQINKRVMPGEADVDRYVGLEHLDPDSLRIRRWGDTSEVESTKLLFQPGDIIFGKRRVYQRKVAVADFEGICSAHAIVLRTKSETALPEFLPFFMQSDLFMERALKEGVDVAANAKRGRELVSKAISVVGKAKLAAAQGAVKASRDSAPLRVIQGSLQEKQKLIQAVIAKQSDGSAKLTLAARNAGQVTENDVDQFLQDLIDLDLLGEDGQPK